MSNHLILLVNLSALIVISILLLLAYKFKKKSMSKSTIVDFQQAFIAQDMVIHHSRQALISVTTVLDNLGNRYNETIGSTNIFNKNDVAVAIKEISARIREQVHEAKHITSYSLVTGECFNDTQNCLMALNEIISNCDNLSVPQIIEEFKLSINKSTTDGLIL